MLIASRIALAATFQVLVWGHAVDGSDAGPELIVSVADQELAFVQHGNVVACYPVSTSKFGLGDSAGSYRTPLGTLFVSGKFGDKLAAGAVIKSRNPTGEVVAPNARGRDAIISRVIWLRGLEEQNRGAHERCIYIHGTPEENRIGKLASFGCIRMRSNDVIALYERVHIGMHVLISRQKINELLRPEDERLFARSD